MSDSSPLQTDHLLLRAIRNGRWKAGEKLPGSRQLAEELGVTSREIHHALSALAAQGYLERKQGTGTVVRARRRVSNVVMLLKNNLHLEQAHSNRLLVEMSRQELEARGYGLVVIDHLFAASARPYADYPAIMERLRRQLEAAEPVGVLEVACALNRFPELYAGFKRPSVRWGRPQQGGDVCFDSAHFLRCSMEHFAARGRRKIAILRKESPYVNDEPLWKAVEKLGFLRCQIRETHRECDLEIERAGYELTACLVDEWKAIRKNYVPDCLLVTDDIMMRGVAAALLQSHLDLPRDLEIISLTNREIPVRFGVPVHRYEVSRRDAARELVDLFELRVARRPTPGYPKTVPGRLRLAAEFE
ncbi:MAG TPA: GntR family transcriptional regulator [Chthoniobacteraceae bacterium]|nr:GntR family transcriptional regulator [Chthoniobacteraceae bacterium]